ncbi:hypothetical protein RJ639_020171 [Escallonia herrerae]|uniref:Uncharacterized protein n=1 Tax=Escallonia herrerae TaxID=1293975 RepID=A0AA88VA81_9ASTE|nr:hypothetical protein RJ639_020171 [Escallonia herrerae]
MAWARDGGGRSAVSVGSDGVSGGGVRLAMSSIRWRRCWVVPTLMHDDIDHDIFTFVHLVDDNFEFKLGMMFNSEDEAFNT